MNLLIPILCWILVGWACSLIAEKKGRDPIVWFYLGVFFSFIALLILYFLPAYKKPKTSPKPEPIDHKEPITNECWFYLNQDHDQVGPVPLQQLKSLWKEGILGSESYVWSEGMKKWDRIISLSLLHQTLTEEKGKS